MGGNLHFSFFLLLSNVTAFFSNQKLQCHLLPHSMPCIQIPVSQSQSSQSLGSSLAYIVFSSVFPGREKAQETQTNWEEQDGAENWGSVPHPSIIMTWDLWKTLYQGHFM